MRTVVPGGAVVETSNDCCVFCVSVLTEPQLYSDEGSMLLSLFLAILRIFCGKYLAML
jgi:hypothetical protein